MKKKFVIVMTALCLAMPFTGNADIFKKIGKALDKVDKAMGEVNKAVGNNSTSTTTQSRSGSEYGAVPGLTMQLNSVERWGDGVRVVFSMTNNTANDIEINLDDKKGVGNRNIHRDEEGNETYGLIDGGPHVNVPAGVTVKRVYMLYGLSATAQKLATMDITGRAIFHDRNMQYFTYGATNVPITTAQNSNSSNVSCSLPVVYVDCKDLKRDGKNVILNFSLKNTATSVINNRYKEFDYAIYDDNGNEYKGKIYRGNATTESWFKALEPDLPLNFHFDILNVPSNVTGFRLIRLFFCDGEYKIEFKNISL